MRKTILTVMVFMCLASAAQARPDDRHGDGGRGGGHGGGWHGHAREARAWHQQHWRGGRYIYGGGPYETYAPPLVVQPPVYDEEPGLNITVPLNFR